MTISHGSWVSLFKTGISFFCLFFEILFFRIGWISYCFFPVQAPHHSSSDNDGYDNVSVLGVSFIFSADNVLQMIMLEGAKATTETVDALRTGAAAMKAMQKATYVYL